MAGGAARRWPPCRWVCPLSSSLLPLRGEPVGGCRHLRRKQDGEKEGALTVPSVEMELLSGSQQVCYPRVRAELGAETRRGREKGDRCPAGGLGLKGMGGGGGRSSREEGTWRWECYLRRHLGMTRKCLPCCWKAWGWGREKPVVPALALSAVGLSGLSLSEGTQS